MAKILASPEHLVLLNNKHPMVSLSTLRAVTVTEFLIGAGMKPESLVAAGYGEFDPVSKSNKSENRRIEIVLLPNIEELPQMPDPGTTKPATPDK